MIKSLVSRVRTCTVLFSLCALMAFGQEANVKPSAAAEKAKPSAVAEKAKPSAVKEEDFVFNIHHKTWSKKSNVAVSNVEDGTALRMSINSEVFSFGWAASVLREDLDYGQYSGIYGKFRATAHQTGGLKVIIITQGKPVPTYYSNPFYSTQGAVISFSSGKWVDFYVPFSALERTAGSGPATVNGSMLKKGDKLELQVIGINSEEISHVDFKDIRFLTMANAAEAEARFERERDYFDLVEESAIDYASSPHPRLLFTPERLAWIRSKAKAGGDAQAAYEGLVRHADNYLRTVNADDPFKGILGFVPSAELNPHRKRGSFEVAMNPRVRPLETLAAVGLITGDKRYSRHAAKMLVNMARSLKVTSPEIDLGFYYTRTFYVRALAFGYDWCWHFLTPEERRDVKATLLGFVKDIYDNSWKHTWGSHPLYRVWNWDPGLVSCTGLGLLAMEGETRLPEEAMLFQMSRHLRDYLTLGIDFDGCGHEGPSYISYGIGSGPEFMECLRDRGLGDLFTETNFHLVAPWLVAETLPNRMHYNNLSDCGHGMVPGAPVYAYAMGRYAELAEQDPARAGERIPAQASAFRKLPFLAHFPETPGVRHVSYGTLASLMGWAWRSGNRDVRSYGAVSLLAHVLFFRDCAPIDDPGKVLPASMWFRGRGLVVSRDNFSKDGFHLAIEAGPHVAGHDQADKGTFTYRGYGLDFFIDSGYGNDGDRLKSGSSYAHNVVLMDGKGQPCIWHNNSNGEITGYHHSDVLDWIRVDALDAWNMSWARQHRLLSGRRMAVAERQFVNVRSVDGSAPYVVVYDNISHTDGKEHDFTWQWHYPQYFTLDIQDGKWVGSVSKVATKALLTDLAPNGYSAQPRNASATFTFTAPAKGKYKLVGLTFAHGADAAKSDSFWLTFGGKRISAWDSSNKRLPTWVEVKERGEATPTSIYLEADETLAVTLHAREPQAGFCKMMLMPYDGELPIAPEAKVPGCVVVDATEAIMGEVPFFLREVRANVNSDGLIEVYPVNSPSGKTHCEWYMTSQEGTHPKLMHSVKAVNPHFVLVLVPKKSPALPSPKSVTKLAGKNPGVCVEWADGQSDEITFIKASVGGDRTVRFVRRRGGKVVHSWTGMPSGKKAGN